MLAASVGSMLCLRRQSSRCGAQGKLLRRWKCLLMAEVTVCPEDGGPSAAAHRGHDHGGASLTSSSCGSEPSLLELGMGSESAFLVVAASIAGAAVMLCALMGVTLWGAWVIWKRCSAPVLVVSVALQEVLLGRTSVSPSRPGNGSASKGLGPGAIPRHHGWLAVPPE
ncbi:hypothetical protein GE061_007596 [Apolygus lucorum]|uniref:Uncharacterized protein n=1 Tax=Apolygus lucorum TaxID=248454 RepID=A0A8S9WRL5_APOLU|nr:hypothetical protein GE061_007596 [Apolygus lucorum]